MSDEHQTAVNELSKRVELAELRARLAEFAAQTAEMALRREKAARELAELLDKNA